MGAASLLNLFSLPRLPWSSGGDDDDKVICVHSIHTCMHAQMHACIYFYLLLIILCLLMDMEVLILQIVLTKAEVESLQSEIADAEEREAHLKAQ